MGHEHNADRNIDDCQGEICTVFCVSYISIWKKFEEDTSTFRPADHHTKYFIGGRLSGALLAGADACAAQDIADEIVTTAKVCSDKTPPQAHGIDHNMTSFGIYVDGFQTQESKGTG